MQHTRFSLSRNLNRLRSLLSVCVTRRICGKIPQFGDHGVPPLKMFSGAEQSRHCSTAVDRTLPAQFQPPLRRSAMAASIRAVRCAANSGHIAGRLGEPVNSTVAVVPDRTGTGGKHQKAPVGVQASRILRLRRSLAANVARLQLTPLLTSLPISCARWRRPGR